MIDPLELLRQWLSEAQKLDLRHPDAFVLATVDAGGRPHQRSLLLKQWSAEGFIFFTNYNSPKARQLGVQPCASAYFYWDALGRQVRAWGRVQKSHPEVGQKYWATRSKASQLAQFVSQQSQPIEGRDKMEKIYSAAKKKFHDRPVPCPEHWGGFELRPQGFEFWQADVRRLHERVVYTKSRDGWSTRILQP